MKTTVHTFASPEEAIAFKAGIELVNDSALETELGPEPNEVTVHDSDASPDDDDDEETAYADRRLQADHPVFSATPIPEH